MLVQRGLPALHDQYQQHAALAQEYDLDCADGDVFFAAAGPFNHWPSLVVVQRFAPCQAGFDPGVALIPSTQTIFLGAGERLLAYRLADPPERLWEDAAEFGFWSWSVHPGAVLMAAELELAAWDHAGNKRWTRFVEPPWDYRVSGGRITLNVMGNVSEIDLLKGT